MLDEEALARPWPFRGRQMEVRYALYRTLEDAQEAHVRVSAADHPESRRILARLADARAETDRWLGDVAPAGMTRPTIWGGYEIDVRFRLHRFAAHVVE